MFNSFIHDLNKIKVDELINLIVVIISQYVCEWNYYFKYGSILFVSYTSVKLTKI